MAGAQHKADTRHWKHISLEDHGEKVGLLRQSTQRFYLESKFPPMVLSKDVFDLYLLFNSNYFLSWLSTSPLQMDWTHLNQPAGFINQSILTTVKPYSWQMNIVSNRSGNQKRRAWRSDYNPQPKVTWTQLGRSVLVHLEDTNQLVLCTIPLSKYWRYSTSITQSYSHL